jgi:cyclopropane fatty-acyl-phospholipid synthase-like methyltransferase
MTRESGFSDVDKSGRSEALVEYLAEMAQEVAERRRQGYELLRLRSGATVLDVGCGAGEVCVELAARV